MLRKAAVAGRFYPAQATALKSEITEYLGIPKPLKKALGIVVPHAGYMYSGHVAGAVYSSISIPRHVIVLCPNHTGMGDALSVVLSGEWEIPLGKVKIDSELAEKLMRHCHLLSENTEAHKFEHSLEVQLPFLYFLKSDFQFVPITIGTGGYALLERLGKAVAETLKEFGEEVLIVASSDMNHYETDRVTRIKDRKAIDKILDLDPKGLYDVIKSESVSMCGYGPVIVMLYGTQYVKERRAELVKYATSADVSGDTSQVVGYAGITVYPQ
jgi:AmmeMemoRadiSam system protein B